MEAWICSLYYNLICIEKKLVEIICFFLKISFTGISKMCSLV